MIDFVTEFMQSSPFGTRVGLRLEEISADHARVSLPFDTAVTTFADVVHGGAMSTLIDVAATAAAWSAAEPTGDPRGATIGLTVDFLQAARGVDLEANARVIRRGRSVCFCEVDVHAGDDLVAKGLVTYKLG
jgi:uncharacterized protein (TIGR00369 family)